jgi:predicted transcriptional regulator
MRQFSAESTRIPKFNYSIENALNHVLRARAERITKGAKLIKKEKSEAYRAQRYRRASFIFTLRQQGYTLRRISGRVGRTQETVRKILGWWTRIQSNQLLKAENDLLDIETNLLRLQNRKGIRITKWK